MFDLPYATHRHLIEPITGHSHVRLTLASRFLGFMDQIKKSQTIIPKMILSHIQCDVRSTTGYNLRKIMLQTDKLNVSELKKDDISKLKYHPTPVEDKLKEIIVNEIIRVSDNAIDVEGFDYEELTDILEFICVS